MKIKIVCVGTLKKSPELDLIQEYLKRSKWKIDFKELPSRSDLTGDSLKEAEAKLILEQSQNLPLIALDERGDIPTSRQFAQIFQDFQNNSQPQVAICIGGADGLHQSVRDQASAVISFGRLTWPHMLVRVLLAEQLYRAQQILSGHPYHRD